MAFSHSDDLLALSDRLREIRFTPRESLGAQILACTHRTSLRREPVVRSTPHAFLLLGGMLIVGGWVYLLWQTLSRVTR